MVGAAAIAAGVWEGVGVALASVRGVGLGVDCGVAAIAGWHAARKSAKTMGMVLFMESVVCYGSNCIALRAWSSKKLGLMLSAFSQALRAPALSPWRYKP